MEQILFYPENKVINSSTTILEISLMNYCKIEEFYELVDFLPESSITKLIIKGKIFKNEYIKLNNLPKSLITLNVFGLNEVDITVNNIKYIKTDISKIHLDKEIEYLILLTNFNLTNIFLMELKANINYFPKCIKYQCYKISEVEFYRKTILSVMPYYNKCVIKNIEYYEISEIYLSRE